MVRGSPGARSGRRDRDLGQVRRVQPGRLQAAPARARVAGWAVLLAVMTLAVAAACLGT